MFLSTSLRQVRKRRASNKGMTERRWLSSKSYKFFRKAMEASHPPCKNVIILPNLERGKTSHGIRKRLVWPHTMCQLGKQDLKVWHEWD